MKTQIAQTIDKYQTELTGLAQAIHSHPELGYQEYYAVEQMTNLLSGAGFEIETGVAGLDTAFVATRGHGSPKIAFIAEYDALKNIGHACGHNLIAAMAVGAAIGLAQQELDCTVSVIGTPAEEGGGGKVIMCQHNVFDDYDVALMIHPATINLIQRGGRASRNLEIEFFGKGAHSAAPEDGINALSALILAFQTFYQMQTLLPFQAAFNGIILDGGQVSNIIPDYARARFSLRARTLADLQLMTRKMVAAIDPINQLIGTTSRVETTQAYAERYPNLPLELALADNLKSMGIEMTYPDPHDKVGSSDIGNVSLRIPTIHSYLAMIPPGVSAHTDEFTQHTNKPMALDMMIIGAKALAQTGYDVVANPALLSDIRQAFKDQVPPYRPDEMNG